ncbi:Hypothetical predicted protein [Paramuricea clavata]|uniref:Uncharacterized protein n=1 Tax=Paramuricea clavata TaxID=317549 RepID=A0A7D9IRB1_PARCT|nr:Hypothetical predicted protein [Paramuricea clavata]
MVVVGDLFQLEPAMHRYRFKNLGNSEYTVLAPNKWQDNFNMFELEEIMRQRESKVFAEILNRLREGKHAEDDILKLKERLIKQNSIQYPMDVSRVTTIEGLFITDPCEDKIAVNSHVTAEMEYLRNEHTLKLSVTPIYKTDQISFKLCYLNAWSLHKHMILILQILTSMFFLKLDV